MVLEVIGSNSILWPAVIMGVLFVLTVLGFGCRWPIWLTAGFGTAAICSTTTCLDQTGQVLAIALLLFLCWIFGFRPGLEYPTLKKKTD